MKELKNIPTKPYFPVLEAEIAKRGIRKKDIAAVLKLTPRSFSQKMTGKVGFWYDEACTIQKTFFNDVTTDILFRHESG